MATQVCSEEGSAPMRATRKNPQVFAGGSAAGVAAGVAGAGSRAGGNADTPAAWARRVAGVKSRRRGCGELLADALRTALETANSLGVSRKMVAGRMGVSMAALDSWVLPLRAQVVPSVRLAQLLGDARVLPDDARRLLADRIAALAGLTAVDAGVLDGGQDDGPAVRQVCEIADRLGRVSALAAAAAEERGPGGEAMTADEAGAMLPAARDLRAEVLQLVAALERVAGERADFPR